MADNVASSYLAKQISDWVVGGTAPTGTGRYMALAVTQPTLAGSFTEVSGTSYARVNLSGKFPASTLGVRTVANTSAIAFPTAGGTWTTAQYWVIMDASSGGNMLGWGEIYPTVTLTNGQTLTLAIGQVSVQVT